MYLMKVLAKETFRKNIKVLPDFFSLSVLNRGRR